MKARGGVEDAANELEDARLIPEERSAEVVPARYVRLRHVSSERESLATYA